MLITSVERFVDPRPQASIVRRGGVVPYMRTPTGGLYIFPVDYRTGDVTDFGGGINARETMVNGAMREFQEESYGIFNPYIVSFFPEALLLYERHDNTNPSPGRNRPTEDMILIFVEVQVRDDYPELFQKAMTNYHQMRPMEPMENSRLVVITGQELEDKLRTVFWDKVGNFLLTYIESRQAS